MYLLNSQKLTYGRSTGSLEFHSRFVLVLSYTFISSNQHVIWVYHNNNVHHEWVQIPERVRMHGDYQLERGDENVQSKDVHQIFTREGYHYFSKRVVACIGTLEEMQCRSWKVPLSSPMGSGYVQPFVPAVKF